MASVASTSLACATLRVSNLERSIKFYTSALSMRLVSQAQRCALVGWPERGALVELVIAPDDGVDPDKAKAGWCSPNTRRDAFVWLGLANMEDVAASIASLATYSESDTGARLQGQLVGDTGDIGFVGHFSDPDGYCLEALQDSMQSSFIKPTAPAPNILCAELPVLGQLKVNSKQPEKLIQFYCEGFGMKVVNKMDMSRFGLTLWFLAFTDDEPPNGLDSVESRIWLWKAKFSQLEIQYFHGYEPQEQLRISPPEAQRREVCIPI
eukprot:2569676-Amphidinium_carterae.1